MYNDYILYGILEIYETILQNVKVANIKKIKLINVYTLLIQY